jgi:predicted nucleotidyltransferase
MWPQRWLGDLFSELYIRHRRDLVTLAEIATLVGSTTRARVAVSRLRKIGLIYVFSVAERRKQYFLADPILLPYLATGRVHNLDLIRQSRYARLIGLFSVEALQALPAIRSVVLYGSVSRGVAKSESDVDLLVLMDSEESVGERIQRLSRVEGSGWTGQELDWLDNHGIYTHISILPLTKEEAMRFPPILLDVLEDGIPIVDDGTFLDIKGRLQPRLVEAGAKRVFISPNEWYWDLAPRLAAGEAYAV